MDALKCFSKIFCAAIVFISIVSYASSITSDYKIIYVGETPYLEICAAEKCDKKKLPQTDFENPSYDLKDLDADSIPEIIIEDHLLGAVNSVSEFYRIDGNGKFVKIENNRDGSISNIKFYNNKVISNYRDSASWFEEVYRYENGKLILETQDQNGLLRKVFDKKGGIVDKYMLVEQDADRDLFERRRAFAKIITDKVMLFNSANFSDKSKMYLVKGDKVALKDNQCSENDTCFYLIEYTTQKGKKIIKWVKDDDVKLDPPAK